VDHLGASTTIMHRSQLSEQDAWGDAHVAGVLIFSQHCFLLSPCCIEDIWGCRSTSLLELVLLTEDRATLLASSSTTTATWVYPH
jgi:hypothetical protein